MLKTVQARFQQHLYCELSDVQTGFRQAEEPEIKFLTSVELSKKWENSRKTYTSALLTTPKPLTVWITTNWKFLKEMGILDHLTCLLRNLHSGQEARVRNEHGTTDWFQMGKEYVKAVHCHPAYLTSMQSISWEMLDWMKHKLESRIPWKIPQTYRWHHPYGRKWRRTKEPPDESERGEWKSWLKTQHSEN